MNPAERLALWFLTVASVAISVAVPTYTGLEQIGLVRREEGSHRWHLTEAGLAVAERRRVAT